MGRSDLQHRQEIPKKKKKNQSDALLESIQALAETFVQEPVAGEWLEKAMDIFNQDWYTVLSFDVAEKAQQQWEDSEMKAKRFYLLKEEAREAYFIHLDHVPEIITVPEVEEDVFNM
jgi:hypothetical protein